MLLARTGIKALELKVLRHIGKSRDSLFYKISREVLTFVNIRLKYPDEQVKGAVEII